MKSNYRTIQTPIPMIVKKEIKQILQQIERIFPKEDIHFQLKNDSLHTNLSALYFYDFQDFIQSLDKAKYKDQAIKIFHTLLQQIDSIKSYGLKEKKRLYVNYAGERKVKNRQEKEKKRGMHYYTLENDFSKTNSSLTLDKANTILCGDSENLLKQYPDNCIDLIFTSPPYNFGLEYKEGEDEHYWESYFNKLFAIFKECIRITKWGGRIVVNVQPLFSDYIPSHHIISHFFMENKMIWKGEILWEKNNYNCKYTSWGSWKSPSSPYLKYTWEFLEVFCKGSLKKTGERDNIDINETEFKKWVTAKWSIAPEKQMQKLGHPAMFPEELVRRVLKLFSFQNDIVLDPFNGVGTTTMTAKKMKRQYIGIDISEEYCQKAKIRLMESKENEWLF